MASQHPYSVPPALSSTHGVVSAGDDEGGEEICMATRCLESNYYTPAGASMVVACPVGPHSRLRSRSG